MAGPSVSFQQGRKIRLERPHNYGLQCALREQPSSLNVMFSTYLPTAFFLE
jgi:hypothetical protein